MLYRWNYLREIVSRSIRYSFNFIGGTSQFILDFIAIGYYALHRKESPLSVDDAMIALVILVVVLMFIFIINLIWEFRWAIPDIKITARRQLIANGNLMVVFDVYNNESEPLTQCYFKLNRFVVFYLGKDSQENIIPDHMIEKFNWQSGDDEIGIPSLESRTANIAKENPDLSNSPFAAPASSQVVTNTRVEENLFLELCTNRKRVVYPDTDVTKDSVAVSYLKFEGELRGVLGEKRIFPKKVCGRVIFKKTAGLEFVGGKPIAAKPTTWLDLEIIKLKEIRNP